MSFDAHSNFALSAVVTAPSPALSGTTLVVTTGQGALFPAVPFNATVWPVGTDPISTNAEIVRVTGISTDTLTITRAQESSTARSILVTDQIAATLTAKLLTDIENEIYQDSIYGKDEPFIIPSGNVFVVANLLFIDASLPALPSIIYEPLANVTIFPGGITRLVEDPLIVDSPMLIDLGGNSQTVLWLDGARAPQVVSTLLIIGI